MALITYGDLPSIREKHKKERIVFASGTFDLPHAGHVLFFEDCKKYGDILVVTVGTDSAVKRNKGIERPVMNERVRLKIISSLKPIDYCLMEADVYEEPLKHIEITFKTLKPDAYVINADAFDIPYRERIAKEHGVELVILERWCPPEFGDISTTKIIEQIKKLGL